MPYTKTGIEQARREMAGGRPDALKQLRGIPVEAEYVGKGPLFVWTGEVWMDWNKWIATTAPIRPEKEK